MSDFKQLFGSTGRSSNNIWMSSTDLMSGLMIVFMFIAIAFMVFVERNEKKTYQIAQEWNRSKIKLLKALHDEFNKDLKKWGAEINDDHISFIFASPEVLFEQGKDKVTSKYKNILNDFFPRYIRLLNEYKNIISEIRIEGHTSKEWSKGVNDLDAYMLNMELSQNRTRNVLEHCLLKNAEKLKKELNWARNKITANGLSSSQLYYVNDIPNRKKSRRVEFRIRTNTEERIEKILAKR